MLNKWFYLRKDDSDQDIHIKTTCREQYYQEVVANANQYTADFPIMQLQLEPGNLLDLTPKCTLYAKLHFMPPLQTQGPREFVKLVSHRIERLIIDFAFEEGKTRMNYLETNGLKVIVHDVLKPLRELVNSGVTLRQPPKRPVLKDTQKKE